MKYLVAMAFVALTTTSAASQANFSSASDDATVESRWTAPSKTVTHAVFAAMDADQKEQINDYMGSNKNIKNTKNLLSATKVRLCNTCSEVFYFVRPSSGQYSPLYGVHSYAFWLVRQDGKVIHSASVDKLVILDEIGGPFRPIEQSICLTSKCYITRLEFRAGKYLPVSCRTYDLAEDKMENNCDQ